MTFIKTTDKMVAIQGIINEWLKDQTFYCGSCGEKLNPAFHIYESCCENPMFGRNVDHARLIVKVNKQTTDGTLKKTGAGKDNTFRYSINMPASLYQMLENYFKKHGEKLFNDTKELHQFMRKFKAFTIPEEV
jgi:hypothetical protein